MSRWPYLVTASCTALPCSPVDSMAENEDSHQSAVRGDVYHTQQSLPVQGAGGLAVIEGVQGTLTSSDSVKENLASRLATAMV